MTAPAQSAPRLRRPDGSAVRVLVVDDERNLTELLSMALRYEGWEVRTAGSGIAAVRVAKEFAPDAVVLDMMLPKRSGFLVLEKIKGFENRPKVIMVTANEGKRHQQYAEHLGVDGYMLKPVRLERLITLAQDLLEAKA